MAVQIAELGFSQERYILFCDNQSAIHLSKNSSFHGKSKHIDIRYHWIRDVLESKDIEMEKIHTDKNIADMLTKVVSCDKLKVCAKGAGLNPQ